MSEEELYRSYLDAFICATDARSILGGRVYSAPTLELERLVAFAIGAHDALDPPRLRSRWELVEAISAQLEDKPPEEEKEGGEHGEPSTG